MNSIIQSILNAVPPVHPDGHKFIAIFAVATILIGWWVHPLFYLGLALTIWCTLFFRNPVRVTPVGDNLVISPADGKVSSVAPALPPKELGLGEEPLMRICVFMSVFDVHVNRAPVAGKVERVAYTPGLFINAELDKASEHNERNGLVISMANGKSLGVVQIAGLIARRILCFVREGEALHAGERFGLIRFGSRLDVYLPEGATPRVAVGQRAVAGETILADLEGGQGLPLVRVG